MASQAELKKRLKVLMGKPENQTCSDCPERQPRWASLIVPPPGSPPGALPIGAFCCLECSGSHRRLGVHISFVRSVNLDSWKEREVQAMENGGNKKVNAIFEAQLHSCGGRKPHAGADGQTRERFIRDKYERRKYFDGSVLQRFYEDESEESSSEEEEPISSRKQKQAQGRNAVRNPSDAAKMRAEKRRSRLSAARTTIETTQSRGVSTKIKAPEKQKKATKPKPPAPAPEMDLLDFGTPASSAPAITATAGPPPSSDAPNPALDLFGNMAISDKGGGQQTDQGSQKNAVAPRADIAATNRSVATTELQDQRKSSNDQILAMFNSPPQQQMAMGMGNMNSMMMPNNMMMMPNMMAMAGNQGVTPQQQQQVLMMQQQSMATRNVTTIKQANGAGNTNMMMQQTTQQGKTVTTMQGAPGNQMSNMQGTLPNNLNSMGNMPTNMPYNMQGNMTNMNMPNMNNMQGNMPTAMQQSMPNNMQGNMPTNMNNMQGFGAFPTNNPQMGGIPGMNQPQFGNMGQYQMGTAPMMMPINNGAQGQQQTVQGANPQQQQQGGTKEFPGFVEFGANAFGS